MPSTFSPQPTPHGVSLGAKRQASLPPRKEGGGRRVRSTFRGPPPSLPLRAGWFAIAARAPKYGGISSGVLPHVERQ